MFNSQQQPGALGESEPQFMPYEEMMQRLEEARLMPPETGKPAVIALQGAAMHYGMEVYYLSPGVVRVIVRAAQPD